MAVGAPLLTSLPPELLLLISEHLAAKELVRLSRTCRMMRQYGCCKSVAKAFMRRKSAFDAIEYLRGVKVNRMDLVIEILRRAEKLDRKLAYTNAALIAAHLNEIKQLESWHAEFGFIPTEVLIGAARSDRIETFEFVFPIVDLNDDTIDKVFETIGERGSQSLFEHLRKMYPELATPKRLQYVVQSAVLHGDLDFAVEVFDCLPARAGKVFIDSACYIAQGAADIGDLDVFSEFIDMFEYSAGSRNEIAEIAAAQNQVEIMRHQETAENSALSLERALKAAVDFNAIDSVQYLLELDQVDNFRVTGDEMHRALISAMKQNHMEIVSLLMPCVSRHSLLHAAAASQSLKAAIALLKSYQMTETRRAYAEPQKIKLDTYNANMPDWKMSIRLIIIGIDVDLRTAESYVFDAARKRYSRVLSDTINLARVMDFDIKDTLTRFAGGASQ